MADIKEKIKKLLALGQSTNENEARSALLKAKELMAKHKMDESEFEDVKKAELVHKTLDSVQWTTDSGKIWMVDLCKVIAENYLCATAWSTRRGTRTHVLEITGFEDDVELCAQVTEYIMGFIENTSRRLTRGQESRSAQSTLSSYAKGFTMGLELAFEEQKDEHPEWGLVVVKPQEVQDFENGLKSRNVRTRRADFDPMAYMKGQKDGQEFNAKKLLTTG